MLADSQLPYQSNNYILACKDDGYLKMIKFRVSSETLPSGSNLTQWKVHYFKDYLGKYWASYYTSSYVKDSRLEDLNDDQIRYT